MNVLYVLIDVKQVTTNYDGDKVANFMPNSVRNFYSTLSRHFLTVITL